jgi:hypothetical protein
MGSKKHGGSAFVGAEMLNGPRYLYARHRAIQQNPIFASAGF